MKKLFLLLLGALILLGCSSDDGKETSTPPSLEVTVDPITTNFVTIRWTYSGSSNAVFRIQFEGETIEETYYGDQYIIEVTENGTYNGVIVASSANNEEVSDSFSFTTNDSGIWFGDLLIDTEQKYIDFNYHVVTGVLTVTNLGEHDLSNLNSLNSVGGLNIDGNQVTSLHGLENLNEVKNSDLFIGNNPNLTSVCCLNSLQEFNIGRFVIEANESLLSVETLSELQSLNNLTIKNNPSLFDLSGLSGLESINYLSIENLPSLTSLEDFTNLTTTGTFRFVGNSLTQLTGMNELVFINLLRIDNNDQLVAVNLQSLEHVGGVSVSGNPLLQTLEFPNVNEIESDGGLFFSNNTSLTSVNIGNPTNVSSILNVHFSDMPNFNNIQGLQSITEFGSLDLVNLPSLTNLSAFSGLESVIGELRLENLPGLTSFDGLNNLISAATYTQPTQSRMYLVGLENISTLAGFDQLRTVGWLWISGNTSLVNLDGTQLQESLPSGGKLHVLSNPNLSDYCGLTTYVNEGNVESATINGNAYNPSLAQIGSETECSL